MTKRMLIDALHPEETRVVIADEKQIYDFDFVTSSKKQLKGNIYLAKITRVEPSLQAAFVEYGGNKQGFLPFAEIHPDYYQIPISDRKRLMEESEEDNTDTSQEASLQPAESTSESLAAEAQETAETSGMVPLAPAIEELPPLESGPEDDRPMYVAESSAEDTVSEEVFPPAAPVDIIPAESAPALEIAPDTTEIPPAATAQEGESVATDAPPAEAVETIQNDEEEIQKRRPKNRFSRRYKIQEVIRRGQVVLIQVIKEERGNKGASLTTYLSLAGRYCVLMPNSPKDGGISRKIASADDRKRLKAISTELRLAAGMSVIIRTAGMDRTRAEIKRDYDYLVKLWNRIREDTLKSNAPALIYEESDVIKRAIRDQYTNDIEEIIIEGDDGYKAAHDFMKLLLPSHTPKVKHYDEATPLFYAYDIEGQLLSMHDQAVKLRSGGYIVINPTEALISIDVNSGRATGERNIEETATKTNLEAAAEVARQLRLRDLAGLIVIDFIDMLDARNRRAVERALKDALKMDRAKIQLGRISPFGLLEMSRQRLRPSISETNMVQCPHCIGRGVVRSNESMSIQMIRALEKEAATGSWSGLRLIAPQAVALHLLNTKRNNLRNIEERHQISIQVLIDADLATSDYNLEKMRRSNVDRNQNDQRRGRGKDRDRPAESTPVLADAILEEMGNEPLETVEEIVESDTSSGESSDAGSEENRYGDNRRRRGGRGRRRRGERFRNDRDERPNFQEPANVDGTTPSVTKNAGDIGTADALEPSSDTPREGRRPSRGNRGGRGRKRWRDRDDHRQQDAKPSSAWPTASEPQAAEAKLPAFATQEPVLMPSAASTPFRRIEAAEPQATYTPPRLPESTSRNPSAPPKKGWWQKMIQLDD